MAGVCTGPGPCDVAPLGTGNNWVTKAGGLPLYIRAVAHALRRSGHSESESIQLAVGTVQRWARGGGKVTAGTRARAAAALAEWERKRAEAHLSGSDAVSIDLAYQWKHGWIPLTPAALAIKLGKSHGHAEGIKANDARKALGTHKDFRAGFEKGRTDVKGHSYSPGDLRDQARKHEAASAAHLQHAGDSFYPDATKDATREAGHAAALRHEAMLSQRRFHHGSVQQDAKDARARGFTAKPDIALLRSKMKAPYSRQYLGGGKPSAADVDALIHNYGVMHGKPPSPAQIARLRKKAGVELSGGTVTTTVDLSQMLPDIASVKKAAAKLSKLPPPLRKVAAARLAARAKQLGATLNLSNAAVVTVIDLAVDQATRDAAKAAGLTFPGSDSYPLAGPDGKFSRSMAKKAVAMVGLGNVGSKGAIQKWLMVKCKANGAGDLIPDSWSAA